MNSQRILVCNWRVHREYLLEAPELHKRIPARRPCVTDVLCNWEIISQIINMCVYSRPDNYYIINSSGVQKCNVIFYYFLRGRRM